uniref:Glycosyltransferase family 2 protein n=1 Tax=Ignavibacterium album TaxID=591197 RepID=A0A832G255_9BACT
MNTNFNPLVSIIVPVYNAEAYLEQCINSLVNQTYKNLEIILVNDGSTDKSQNIIELFASQDQRIKVICKNNEGLSFARNNGIEAATGKYLVFLDSDDWLELNTIEIALNDMIHHSCDLVMWQMIKEYKDFSVKVEGPFKEDRIFTNETMSELYKRAFGPTGNQLKEPQLIDSFLSAWGKLYNSDLINKYNISFIDTKSIGSEDILFNIHYLHYCKRVKYLHKHLIHYRKTETASITKSHGSTLYPRFLNLFDYLFSEIRIKKLDESFFIALNNRIAISMMNIGLSEVSPRNTIPSKNKIINIKRYLNDPLYVNAYSKLDFKYFPIHWAFFFILCKRKNAIGVFLLLKIMRLFIKK